jgi:hypothetical protein
MPKLTLTMDQALALIAERNTMLANWIPLFKDPDVPDTDRRKLLRLCMRSPAECSLTPAEYAVFKQLSREPSKQLSVNLPVDVFTELQEQAKAQGVPTSKLARRVITRYLGK